MTEYDPAYSADEPGALSQVHNTVSAKTVSGVVVQAGTIAVLDANTAPSGAAV